VCLSAAILTKQGKVLLARQFVEMTRIKVENHLTTFPKLVGTERQHNVVETADVRYVYQPIEQLVLVLTTSKLSNIVEDLETLRLFARLIPEYCPGEVDEAAVTKHAFELLFAFDEVISCGVGHREDLTLQQVQTNLEMESHEEKLAIMIRDSKVREAQNEAKLRAKQIARDNRTKGIAGGGVGGGIESMKAFAEDLSTGAARAATAMDAAMPSLVDPSGMRTTSYTAPPKAGKGMALGAKGLGKGALGGGASLLAALGKEAEEAPVAAAAPRGQAVGGAIAAPGAGGAGGGGISLTAEEKLSVSLSRDGGLQSMTVNGELQLIVSDPAHGKAIVPLTLGENAGFQFKTHPNINKPLFASDSSLGLRDPSRPFPTGSSVGVLKWRLASTDEALVPLLVNCWPTQTGGDSWEVNVEYELAASTYPSLNLHDLKVIIPAPADSATAITASNGTATFSKRDGAVTWHVPLIDASTANANVEFTLHGLSSSDALFPINVAFSGAPTLCELAVPEVRSAEEGGGTLPFSTGALLTVESYTIS